jgi:hypothetical protein
MLAWKVPSWSQYFRMRSSMSGNFTDAETPPPGAAEGEAEALG